MQKESDASTNDSWTMPSVALTSPQIPSDLSTIDVKNLLTSLMKESSFFPQEEVQLLLEDAVDVACNETTREKKSTAPVLDSSSTLRSLLLTTPAVLSRSNEVARRRHSTTSLSFSKRESLLDNTKLAASLNKSSCLINSLSSSQSASPISSTSTSPRRVESPCCDLYRIDSLDMVLDNDTQMSSIRKNCRDLNLGSFSDGGAEDGTFSESGRTHHNAGLRHWENGAIPAKQRRSLHQSHVSAVAMTASSTSANEEVCTYFVNSDHPALRPSAASLVKAFAAIPVAANTNLVRLPSLSMSFPQQHGQTKLLILNQPEEQHRARYMTEGSRGAVKDRTGKSYPSVQLCGWNQPTTLQIFVGRDDAASCRPHGIYQASKVLGTKSCASCEERQLEQTSVIEVHLDPHKSMIVVLDCIGIVKLRNADVEQRMGSSCVDKTEKKSASARLVFRVNMTQTDGTIRTLQVASQPILCTQPIGSPEICRMSLLQGSVLGGQDIFIIGRNFGKASKLVFLKRVEGQGVVWESEAVVEKEFLHQTHLIARTPPFCVTNIQEPTKVQVIVQSGARVSEPRYFTYLPDSASNLTCLQDAFNSTALSLKPSSLSYC